MQTYPECIVINSMINHIQDKRFLFVYIAYMEIFLKYSCMHCVYL